ncbi:hypothetical protein KSP40_PGU004839 [Platanthera guangdongensis]|uniref:Uncharacterized protein n=1 Tax=Platanthera guangdongensis TaxID=2320717 RepID=A0ABR2LRQ4_9ASPA
MKYAFAESWAPDFGNAILSKWPIKQSRVQKICNHDDFRNVLKVTIEVPGAGEVDLHCTHLDHLDEDWRLKQIGVILGSSEQQPHILAAGLNALDETDYSAERWDDIVKLGLRVRRAPTCKDRLLPPLLVLGPGHSPAGGALVVRGGSRWFEVAGG